MGYNSYTTILRLRRGNFLPKKIVQNRMTFFYVTSMGCASSRSIDSRSNDAHSKHNYATMLTLYRDNLWYHRKEKYRCDMQRLVSWVKKTSLTKDVFLFNIFWWNEMWWYMRKLFQQVVSVFAQLNQTEHDFQKQLFANVLQIRCS